MVDEGGLKKRPARPDEGGQEEEEFSGTDSEKPSTEEIEKKIKDLLNKPPARKIKPCFC